MKTNLKKRACTLCPMMLLYGSRISRSCAEDARERDWVLEVSLMRRVRLRLLIITVNNHSDILLHLLLSINFFDVYLPFVKRNTTTAN